METFKCFLCDRTFEKQVLESGEHVVCSECFEGTTPTIRKLANLVNGGHKHVNTKENNAASNA